MNRWNPSVGAVSGEGFYEFGSLSFRHGAKDTDREARAVLERVRLGIGPSCRSEHGRPADAGLQVDMDSRVPVRYWALDLLNADALDLAPRNLPPSGGAPGRDPLWTDVKRPSGSRFPHPRVLGDHECLHDHTGSGAECDQSAACTSD